MITSVEVRNFKRFRHVSVSFRALTVLTGLNGSGKSTLIQALLLARQASEGASRETDDGNGRSVVQLNGPHGLALGEAFDVLHPEADVQEVDVTVRAGASSYAYRFGVPDERSLNLNVLARPKISPSMFGEHGQVFTYLNAERLGPRDQLGVTAEDLTRLGVGEQGQFTGQVLAVFESEQVRRQLQHPRTEPGGVTTLRTQVEAWISEIIRPMRITAKWPPGMSASIIRFQEPSRYSEPIRPNNMGFGFSYVLPIVVAGLLMKPDGLLIVENPEAHLHPGGQSRIGQFLATVAGSDVQVVVETHSDHVVNGIRLAAVERENLPPDEVVLQFFDDDLTGPKMVDVGPTGVLSDWPKGFFDQIEEDLGRLTRAKRNRS